MLVGVDVLDCFYRNHTTPIINSFLTRARSGNVDVNLFHHMSGRAELTEDSAGENAGPDAVWIAHENKVVKKYNVCDFQEKVRRGARYFRLVALLISFILKSLTIIP